MHLPNHYDSLKRGVEAMLEVFPDPRTEDEIVEAIVKKVSKTLADLEKRG